MTNVQNLGNDFDFTISPNPVQEQLHLDFGDTKSAYLMQIIDNMGKIIETHIIKKNSKTIDVSNWNAGLYFIRLEHQGQLKTRSFIKQ